MSLLFQLGFLAGFKNTLNTKQPAFMVFYAGRGMGISFQIGAGADADFGKMAGDFVRFLVSSKNGAEAGARAGKKSGPMEAPGWKFKNQIWSESFIQCGFSVNNFAK